MREILFRGKRVDSGEWVEGSLVVATGGFNNGEHYILATPSDFYYGDNGNRIRIGCFVEVIPETVGQYTGVKDKNGKRIFEGDILRHHNDYPDSEIKEVGYVFWDEKYCGWRRTSNGEFHHGVVDTYRLSHSCVYEIIGNVYDNEGLLDDNKM